MLTAQSIHPMHSQPAHAKQTNGQNLNPLSPNEGDKEEVSTWVRVLPKLLRSLGAAAVLFSLYSFLFKGWEGSSDLIRYSMLLGHTLLLTILALGSGYFFREGKGPRLLMMLSLVSVPVNFAILGAFIASGTALALSQQIPSYVYWTIDNLSTALITASVASLLLVPVVILAFRTLARSLSRPMTILFIATNLMLLIPIRDALFASLIPLAAAAITLLFSTKTARERTESKTLEGMMALLVLFLPAGIMLGRDLWLHHHSVGMIVAAGLMTFIVLRHIAEFVATMPIVRTICELLAVAVSFVTGVAVFGTVIDFQTSFSIAAIAGAAVTSALIYEISLRRTYLSKFYKVIALAVMIFVAGSTLLLANGLSVSVLCSVIGVALIVLSHKIQERSMLMAGALLFVGGIAEPVFNMVVGFDFSYWPVLALGGVVAILLGSFIESRGAQLKHSISRHRNHYANWEF